MSILETAYSSGSSCGSKSYQFQLITDVYLQANRLAELPQDRARQESNTELLICSRVNNDERSLGLSGIKWVIEFLINVIIHMSICTTLQKKK